jgi:hypothetical protein
MKYIIRFLGLSLLFGFLYGCASNSTIINDDFAPKIKRKEKAAVMLAYVTRQNYIIPSYSERSGITPGTRVLFPDGLVFYFLIKPLEETAGQFIIAEKQNFKINGNEYDITDGPKGYKTLEDGSREIVSLTPQIIFYDVKYFINEEPELARYFLEKGYISEETDIHIQKNIICGAKLPEDGLLQYTFSIGLKPEDIEPENIDLEYFDFELELNEIQ